MSLNPESLVSEIPVSLANAAYQGVSFDPEGRAQRSRSDYAITLMADYEELRKHAQTPEQLALFAGEFNRYREGCRKRYCAYLHSSSRCVSTLIAGPSNFPAARMNRRADIAHKRINEYLEFRQRAKDAILKKLHPECRPIMAGDDNAVDRIREKIDEAEQLQAAMKAANAAIRKHAKAGREAQIQALLELGHSEDRAAKLLERDFCGRIGFPDYALTNNSANIRCMKDRLAVVERNKSASNTVQERENARIEDCPAENRIRLFFPGKPDAAIRTRLKSRGFRWSPTVGCWQAYRNDSTIPTAKEIAGAPVESSAVS